MRMTSLRGNTLPGKSVDLLCSSSLLTNIKEKQNKSDSVAQQRLDTNLVRVVEELEDGEDAGADEQTHLTADVTWHREDKDISDHDVEEQIVGKCWMWIGEAETKAGWRLKDEQEKNWRIFSWTQTFELSAQ